MQLIEYLNLGNRFTFPKSRATKTAEKMYERDLRRNLVEGSPRGYIKRARISNRILKGSEGLKFGEFNAIKRKKLDLNYNTSILDTPIQITPVQRLIPSEYSDLNRFKDLDTILNELEHMENSYETAIPKSSLASMSLDDLVKLENLPIKITSSSRPNSKTKSGNVSNHSKKDNFGNPMAYDILPMFNGIVDKSDEGFIKLTDILMNNSNVKEWMLIHGFGLFDETTPEIMAKTGATGKHFHIGPDKIAIKGWNELLTKYNLT